VGLFPKNFPCGAIILASLATKEACGAIILASLAVGSKPAALGAGGWGWGVPLH